MATALWAALGSALQGGLREWGVLAVVLGSPVQKVMGKHEGP